MPVADEPDLIVQEYADDTLLFLHYSHDVLDTIRYALEVFCVASGARMNWDKSYGILAGSNDVPTWGPVDFTWLALMGHDPVRLNRDHPNRAKFEPEQGLDPTLDLALVGADWQLKVQGRARNWQDNLVITSTRSGEPDDFTRTEAARVFESQLADSLLEGNGQLAFKKLAAATVETLMPKIEGKGEFGQARWRLVSAPQIPNLLSLDPTTDPFKSLANLSFGTEVEVQLGKRLQASVVRQLKESEMATQWTLIYHLSNKLRVLFSSIPSVDNRLLFEYSATSQN
ncbi:hypothetical protein L7F22_023947 [Adiantum nelumboides]|nr:hypothetical protein [Adiantum nelumboides]